MKRNEKWESKFNWMKSIILLGSAMLVFMDRIIVIDAKNLGQNNRMKKTMNETKPLIQLHDSIKEILAIQNKPRVYLIIQSSKIDILCCDVIKVCSERANAEKFLKKLERDKTETFTIIERILF